MLIYVAALACQGIMNNNQKPISLDCAFSVTAAEIQ